MINVNLLWLRDRIDQGGYGRKPPRA